MAKRSKSGQNAHDRKVKKIANQLRNQGWNVRADLPNYQKPDPIGKKNRIPDVEATKRGHRKIIEVETPGTEEKDKKQAETFRRHAGQKPNTTFDLVVTDE
jgi:hypothetical protein